MFFVTEIQINSDGTAGNITNSYSDSAMARNKYFTILAAAAVSDVPKHGAFLYTENGFIAHECFTHESN